MFKLQLVTDAREHLQRAIDDYARTNNGMGLRIAQAELDRMRSPD